MSSLGKQDKDFKRLNKESLAHNATTAHEQYMYRQSSDCRITHPSLRKSFYASGGFTGFQHPTPLPAFLNAEHTYGLPLRPGTPIKAVVGNLYGEVAAYQKKKYHQSLNEQDKVLLNRLLNPPRNETRASKMASTFTNMNYKNALTHFLTLGAILFTLSVIGIFLNRKNLIVLLMAIELMLLAVNMNFVAFSHYLGDMHGQVFVFFILTVAAAESAIGLAILVLLFRNKSSIRVDELNALKG